jgi:hypothetical protein
LYLYSFMYSAGSRTDILPNKAIVIISLACWGSISICNWRNYFILPKLHNFTVIILKGQTLQQNVIIFPITICYKNVFYFWKQGFISLFYLVTNSNWHIYTKTFVHKENKRKDSTNITGQGYVSVKTYELHLLQGLCRWC